MIRERGRLLAQALPGYKNRRDVVVLAITPASVAIAEGVADVLRVAFDIFLVRTIPGGAVARGAYVPNAKALSAAGVSLIAFVDAARIEEQTITELEARYREGRPAARLTGASIVLVDDGTSGPEDLLAAITAIRRHGVNDLVVVSPVTR